MNCGLNDNHKSLPCHGTNKNENTIYLFVRFSFNLSFDYLFFLSMNS